MISRTRIEPRTDNQTRMPGRAQSRAILLLALTLLLTSACTAAPRGTPTAGGPQGATPAPQSMTTPTPARLGSAPAAPSVPAGAPPISQNKATPTPANPAPTVVPSPIQTSAPFPSATRAASATAVARHTSEFAERPLAELAPEAAAFLETREEPRGAAVIVPGRATIYTHNGDELTPMASVAKVAIMVTVMDQAMRANRPLTEWEMSMLRPMITVSDNDSASALWEYIGGGAAVAETLRSMGLVNTVPNPMEAWGASRSTPKEVALLLSKIALGEILDKPNRELALSLMGQVDPNQTWGISAGVPTNQLLHADVAIKDGWNPTQGGWWVNSAGLVMPLGSQPMYALAILTRQQPSMEYGIATIEGVASRVHAALHPQPTPTPGG